MKTKHTPGPWIVGHWTILNEDRQAQKEGRPFWTFVEPKYEGNCLAQGPLGRKTMDTEHIIETTGFGCDGIVMDDADEALIVAAPDLLEASINLINSLDSRFVGHLSNDSLDSIKQLCVAINKAEGGDK